MMPPLHGERLRGYMPSMREVTARAVPSRLHGWALECPRCRGAQTPGALPGPEGLLIRGVATLITFAKAPG